MTPRGFQKPVMRHGRPGRGPYEYSRPSCSCFKTILLDPCPTRCIRCGRAGFEFTADSDVAALRRVADLEQVAA